MQIHRNPIFADVLGDILTIHKRIGIIFATAFHNRHRIVGSQADHITLQNNGIRNLVGLAQILQRIKGPLIVLIDDDIESVVPHRVGKVTTSALTFLRHDPVVNDTAVLGVIHFAGSQRAIDGDCPIVIVQQVQSDLFSLETGDPKTIGRIFVTLDIILQRIIGISINLRENSRRNTAIGRIAEFIACCVEDFSHTGNVRNFCTSIRNDIILHIVQFRTIYIAYLDNATSANGVNAQYMDTVRLFPK